MGTFRPESLRIWITHPRNRRNIQSDLLIFTLLSVVTVGLVTVCLLGDVSGAIGPRSGPRLETCPLRSHSALIYRAECLLAVTTETIRRNLNQRGKDPLSLAPRVTTGFSLSGQDQVSPWYRWWKSTVNVRLIRDPQLFRPPSESFQPHEGQTLPGPDVSFQSIRNGQRAS
ncbi:hypothetical protein E2986_13400 [Frieseomelitta varia]|uniref:Uncharacterized protein n=1 Tax=Frieseomelitta varia TaxID=561572 RepID=A0A833SDR3_9HYME|nr:hypothetical protein E2986_13400 [Frieseomelitta varia]